MVILKSKALEQQKFARKNKPVKITWFFNSTDLGFQSAELSDIVTKRNCRNDKTEADPGALRVIDSRIITFDIQPIPIKNILVATSVLAPELQAGFVFANIVQHHN
mmetsp:Transcript_5239/g.6314  ORF Transcript_5239/g.6314 Transcript_5239/m.6314 type:complete len:106 (+) Transcript_5239:1261-1578(+)